MPSYNRLTLVGHLGREPETSYMPSGDARARFSVPSSYKRGGEEHTTWVNVTVFGKLAETCSQYLHKGSLVLLEGSVELREYQKKDGTQGASLEMIAREMRMLDRVGERAEAVQLGFSTQAASTQAAARDSDPVPF